jgi:hypothetical protein
MTAAYAYPETIYKPQVAADLRSAGERKRLSGPGLRAFFNIIDRTGIRDADAREILGGVSNGPYYAMKKSPNGKVLGVDTLQRISYLIGIYKALHILHSKPLADEWLKLPNSNHLFAGMTPIEYMVRGGMTAMQSVRRLLDARRGGGV